MVGGIDHLFRHRARHPCQLILAHYPQICGAYVHFPHHIKRPAGRTRSVRLRCPWQCDRGHRDAAQVPASRGITLREPLPEFWQVTLW